VKTVWGWSAWIKILFDKRRWRRVHASWFDAKGHDENAGSIFLPKSNHRKKLYMMRYKAQAKTTTAAANHRLLGKPPHAPLFFAAFAAS
jgi:hypothetical protein